LKHRHHKHAGRRAPNKPAAGKSAHGAIRRGEPDTLPTNVHDLQEMVKTLQFRVLQLERMIFGRRSERLLSDDPAQGFLFGRIEAAEPQEESSAVEQESAPSQEEASQADEEPAPPRRNARHPGRRPLPARLMRCVHDIHPAEAEQTCPSCGHGKRIFGSDVTEELEMIPAKYFVNRYVRGYMWVYIGEHGDVVFDYTNSHERNGPASFLKGYRGYLQADAFSGYDGIYAGGEIFEVACWAHARRKFYETLVHYPTEAKRILEMIASLYAVESRAKKVTTANLAKCGPLTPDEKLLAWRQRFSRRRLERLRRYLDELSVQVLPKSPLGKAISYALKNWKALNRYTEASFLSIDNNLSERQVKQMVIGRNYAQPTIMRSRREWYQEATDRAAVWSAP
jgi:hypothetical protein